MYVLVGLMVVTETACAALFRGVGSVVESCCGATELRSFARMHASLSEVALRLDRLTSDSFVPLLSAVLLLPILGTYDAVQGRVDSYLLSSFPIILVVFVPLCYGGQVRGLRR